MSRVVEGGVEGNVSTTIEGISCHKIRVRKSMQEGELTMFMFPPKMLFESSPI